MKYLVSVNEKSYYLATEIEAEDADIAGEKYMKMVDRGDIPINESEFEEIKVETLDLIGRQNKIK